MIFKSKNGDTIECTPSEFLELAAVINAAKEEDKGDDSIECHDCPLCEEHEYNCTTCPNNSSDKCYYDEHLIKENDKPEIDECCLMIDDVCPLCEEHDNYEFDGYCSMIDGCCELCKEHDDDCTTCPNAASNECYYKKNLHEGDEEEEADEEDDEEFIFNDIFISHPETSEGTKLINDYVFGVFKGNYFYHPDIIVTCAADDLPAYRDLYIARDKEGYGVLFKDVDAFIKAMHDNGIDALYLKIYHDNHDKDMHWRFLGTELKVVTEQVSKKFMGGLKND